MDRQECLSYFGFPHADLARNAAGGFPVQEIGRLANDESHGAEFALSVKATLVMGQRALSQ